MCQAICETQQFTDQKLSSTIFTCPVPSRPSRIGDISIYANIYRFWALMPVFIIYMMHVWWYLVVSGACLVVSGACLVVSGACLVVLMYIGWYDRNWYIWADIPSDACNWCANAADALMLLMRCCCLCCWCADAADALMLLMRWCCWYADAADKLMLLMRLCCWWADTADADAADVMMLLMHWCCWCADAADMLMLLMGSCCWCVADAADALMCCCCCCWTTRNSLKCKLVYELILMG